jgi:hypothetical protein
MNRDETGGPALEMDIRVTVEERPDRWAAWSPEFGCFGYGRTEEEAGAALDQMVRAFAHSFGSAREELLEWLESKRVRFQMDGHESPGELQEESQENAGGRSETRRRVTLRLTGRV